MSTITFLTAQQEVASQSKLDLSVAEQATLVKRWINQSQQRIWGAAEWPWALDREIVQTVADKTDGTVSISSGGTTVTGSSTAFASTDEGSFIQFSSSNDWYKILTFGSATSIELEKPYTGTSALSGGTYRIRKVFYSVSSTVERILTMRQAIGPNKLVQMPFSDFDTARPDPTGTGNPTRYLLFGYDSSNNWRFTPYPYPSSVMNLELRVKRKATDLSGNDDVSLIPEQFHQTVLIDGALVRAHTYNKDYQLAAIARTDFQAGLDQMKEYYTAEPDWAPRVRNPESSSGIDHLFNLPEDFDTGRG